MVRRPATRSRSEVLAAPLAAVTASASPEEISKSRPENTSRPPRTHLTSRPESRILLLHSPLKSIGTTPEFVGTALLRHDCRCGGAPGKILEAGTFTSPHPTPPTPPPATPRHHLTTPTTS